MIDQFEDLFAPSSRGRQGVPPTEAQVFIDNVVDAVERGGGRLRAAIAPPAQTTWRGAWPSQV